MTPTATTLLEGVYDLRRQIQQIRHEAHCAAQALRDPEHMDLSKETTREEMATCMDKILAVCNEIAT